MLELHPLGLDVAVTDAFDPQTLVEPFVDKHLSHGLRPLEVECELRSARVPIRRLGHGHLTMAT